MEIAVVPSRNTILLRSLVNIIVGVILLAWPAATLIVLVYAFAINILLIGMGTLLEPAFDKSSKGTLISVLLGLLGIIAGIYLIATPLVSGEIISLLIAFWAIVFGVSDIFVGFSAQEKGSSNLLLILVGIISVVFGIYVLNSPLDAILDLIWVIGVYALLVGFVLGMAGLFFYPKTKKSSK